MWHYQRECSPDTGNPRIVLQHEAFGLSWPAYSGLLLLFSIGAGFGGLLAARPALNPAATRLIYRLLV